MILAPEMIDKIKQIDTWMKEPPGPWDEKKLRVITTVLTYLLQQDFEFSSIPECEYFLRVYQNFKINFIHHYPTMKQPNTGENTPVLEKFQAPEKEAVMLVLIFLEKSMRYFYRFPPKKSEKQKESSHLNMLQESLNTWRPLLNKNTAVYFLLETILVELYSPFFSEKNYYKPWIMISTALLEKVATFSDPLEKKTKQWLDIYQQVICAELLIVEIFFGKVTEKYDAIESSVESFFQKLFFSPQNLGNLQQLPNSFLLKMLCFISEKYTKNIFQIHQNLKWLSGKIEKNPQENFLEKFLKIKIDEKMLNISKMLCISYSFLLQYFLQVNTPSITVARLLKDMMLVYTTIKSRGWTSNVWQYDSACFAFWRQKRDETYLYYTSAVKNELKACQYIQRIMEENLLMGYLVLFQETASFDQLEKLYLDFSVDRLPKRSEVLIARVNFLYLKAVEYLSKKSAFFISEKIKKNYRIIYNKLFKFIFSEDMIRICANQNFRDLPLRIYAFQVEAICRFSAWENVLIKLQEIEVSWIRAIHFFREQQYIKGNFFIDVTIKFMDRFFGDLLEEKEISKWLKVLLHHLCPEGHSPLRRYYDQIMARQQPLSAPNHNVLHFIPGCWTEREAERDKYLVPPSAPPMEPELARTFSPPAPHCYLVVPMSEPVEVNGVTYYPPKEIPPNHAPILGNQAVVFPAQGENWRTDGYPGFFFGNLPETPAYSPPPNYSRP